MNNCCNQDENNNFSPRRVIYCAGPTGPTGPQGPTTVTVGLTTTSNPGEVARVTNSGTNQNAILDFAIPAGATGPTGPTGPRGVPGLTGATGSIGPIGATSPNT